ncbi:MAG: DNA alkylation repair protein [Deltaproteobacteria bacterium]|jgi:3-methyladenine DNA glycosylase AlkD|nr:DNA alkylation repair protein [Deltaproteobacteria bacterium]
MRAHASEIVAEVLAAGNPALAVRHQKFFRAFPGGYGEGDRFAGLTVPQLRGIAGKYAKSAGLQDINALLDSPWHEARFVALVLLNGFSTAAAAVFPFGQKPLPWSEYMDKDAGARRLRSLPANPGGADYAQCQGLYLARREAVNNWDLVDVSAPVALGPAIYHDATVSAGKTLLERLAESGRLWCERMSVVSGWYAIKRGEYKHTLGLAEFFIRHKHDLMHKACGWMLREVGKRDRDVLSAFLESHAHAMPRTMLRYAIEHYGEEERAGWRAKTN